MLILAAVSFFLDSNDNNVRTVDISNCTLIFRKCSLFSQYSTLETNLAFYPVWSAKFVNPLKLFLNPDNYSFCCCLKVYGNLNNCTHWVEAMSGWDFKQSFIFHGNLEELLFYQKGTSIFLLKDFKKSHPAARQHPKEDILWKQIIFF